jgi:hypothetical protein
MGVTVKPDNCVFSPIPLYLRQADSERPGCRYTIIGMMKQTTNWLPVNLLRVASEAPNHSTTVLNDLQNLEQSLIDVVSMIERVQNYVHAVIDGDIKGDPTIGRYLLDTLNTTTEGLEKGKLESLFNAHVQVCVHSTSTVSVKPDSSKGYIDGFLSCKLSSITSRSVKQIDSCNIIKILLMLDWTSTELESDISY